MDIDMHPLDATMSTVSAFLRNIRENGPGELDFDEDFSDDDTFADADSDCEPDLSYLNEMLDEGHPDRLNLFDHRTEKSASLVTVGGAENDAVNHGNSATGRSYDINVVSDHDHEQTSETGNSDSNDGDEIVETGILNEDAFGVLSTIGSGRRKQIKLNNYGAAPGPGRSMLRQPSQKAVWGK